MLLNYSLALSQTGQVLSAEAPTATEALQGAVNINRTNIAAFALLIYDILITFDDEVAFVWPKPWSFMKSNYFIIRYIPLLVQIPLLLIGPGMNITHITEHLPGDSCFSWLVFKGASCILIVISLDYILTACIFALYFDNYAIRVVVGVAYVLEIVLMILGIGLATPGIVYSSTCVAVYIPDFMLCYSTASIGFQTLLFALTLYRFVHSVRAGWGNIPVVRLLMRDGTWAFLLVFAGMLSQAALFGVRNPVYIGVLYGWLLTSFSFCGYRIFLNINRVPVDINIAPHRSSSIQFTSILVEGTYAYAYESNAGDTHIDRVANHERTLLSASTSTTATTTATTRPSSSDNSQSLHV